MWFRLMRNGGLVLSFSLISKDVYLISLVKAHWGIVTNYELGHQIGYHHSPSTRIFVGTHLIGSAVCLSRILEARETRCGTVYGSGDGAVHELHRGGSETPGGSRTAFS